MALSPIATNKLTSEQKIITTNKEIHNKMVDVSQKVKPLVTKDVEVASENNVLKNNLETSFKVNMTVMSTIGVGSVIIEVYPKWAPLGAKRFYELVNNHYFDGAKFFRVLKNFMAQFGINKDPILTKQWQGKSILDDPVMESNTRGKVSYAMAGKNTRSNQIFINYGNNKYLDKEGFAPFAQVLIGMEFIDALYNGYGEGGKGD
eukprot:gene15383-20743_t